MNILTAFFEIVARRGKNIAIVAGDRCTISYDELALRSARLASSWKLKGICVGDRVLLAMPVGIELYIAIAALWRLGAVIVFPEPGMGLPGLRNSIRITNPKAVLTAGVYRVLPVVVSELRKVRVNLYFENAPAGADIVEDVSTEHPALISFTSGSTGNPKAIVRSHGFLAAQNACVADMLSSDNETDIDLVAFPVFVIANLSMGATSVLPNWNAAHHDKVSAKRIYRRIVDHDVNRALIPPSICKTLTHVDADPKLKAIFTGGGPIFPDLMKGLASRLPDTSVWAVYGSTEAEPIAHQLLADICSDDWRAMESGAGLLAGAAVPQTTVRIVDDEILVTGEHVNKSYLNGHGDEGNKVKLENQIWHRTGDAGRLDGRGRIWLRGRWSAKVGSLFPFEVEVAARSWSGVREAAFLPYHNHAILALAGEDGERRNWQAEAEKLGPIRVVKVRSIPLDRRHRSKVDYAALKKIIQ